MNCWRSETVCSRGILRHDIRGRAHLGERGENLAYVSDMLDAYPNVSVDMSARVAELGRQPYTARAFFLRYADRILFGTDLFPPEIATYRLHFRFLETDDQYFEYPSHASRQGRWNIFTEFICLRMFCEKFIARTAPAATAAIGFCGACAARDCLD